MAAGIRGRSSPERKTPMTITDATTREELIAQINDLDEEVQKLETKIEDQALEIEDMRLVPAQRGRLMEAADLMAELGRIHNTPHAKFQWAKGN
jgi:phage host-nuclease inhibitor protein Gam